MNDLAAVKYCYACRQDKPIDSFRLPCLNKCTACYSKSDSISRVFKASDPVWVEKERVRSRNKMRLRRLNPEYKKHERLKDLAYKKKQWRESAEFRRRTKEQRRLRYNSNPEWKKVVTRRNMEWNKSPRGRHYACARRHKERDNGKTLRWDEWQQILLIQENKCACCHQAFSDALKATRDHIIPVTKGGSLSFGNTQALCKSCNSKKGNRVEVYRQDLLKTA